MQPISGIHHITAIAGDPQRNLDFYTQVLGLRMVKLTVNFDDPGTYHFYFADETGRPGTVLTFFPWPNTRRGRRGTGQLGSVAFAIPTGSTGFWQERFKHFNVTTSSPFQRFDEDVLTLMDPDGLQIEMIAGPGAAEEPYWSGGPVEEQHAVRGFAGPTLLVSSYEETAALLSDTFGLKQTNQHGPRYRFAAQGTDAGKQVDLEVRPQEQRGQMGGGIVHHIAWRAADDAEQLEWREKLLSQGYDVTPVHDRQYFHSIYFREPGGVLFEIATDPPGFTLDETVETLGSQLRLPPWLEPRRKMIADALPPLTLPAAEQAGK